MIFFQMIDIFCFRFGVKITFGTAEIKNEIIVIEIDQWDSLLCSKYVTFEKS